MSVASEKFSNLNKQRKATELSVTNAVSQLNAAIDVAIKQQVYMHKNPDNNNATELLAVCAPNFLKVVEVLNEIAEKSEDMQALYSGGITAEEMVSKYIVDLAKFSNELI